MPEGLGGRWVGVGPTVPGRQRAAAGTGPGNDDLRAGMVEVAATMARRRHEWSQVLLRDVVANDRTYDDPRLRALMIAATEANFAQLASLWELGIPVERVQVTAPSVELVRVVAQHSAHSTVMVRTVQFAQIDVLGFLREAVAEVDAPDRLRFELYHRVVVDLLRYNDHISGQLQSVFDEERQRWLGDPSTTHASLVHQMLTEPEADPDLFARQTGYRLDRPHLGAVLWTQEPGGGVESGRVLQWLAQAAGSTGAPLTTALDRSVTWAWLPQPSGQPTRRLDLDALRSRLGGTPWHVALGATDEGQEGFRRTHEQAVAVHRLQRDADGGSRTVLSYGDDAVAVVARMAEDVASTRSWVAEVLGPLARVGESEQRLRQTLLTFVASGGSYARSAVLLQVHPNTVKYRVRRAVEVRGRPLEDDRLNLELALQVCSYLGERVLTSS